MAWSELTFLKRIAATLLVVMVGLASSACAVVPGEVFHSVSIINYSSAAIRKVTLRYGDEVLQFPNRYPPRGMATEAGEMKVPDDVVVEWENASGVRQVERIPIKLQGINRRGLSNLTIRFTDSGIELYQGVNSGPASRDSRRIYPD